MHALTADQLLVRQLQAAASAPSCPQRRHIQGVATPSARARRTHTHIHASRQGALLGRAHPRPQTQRTSSPAGGLARVSAGRMLRGGGGGGGPAPGRAACASLHPRMTHCASCGLTGRDFHLRATHAVCQVGGTQRVGLLPVCMRPAFICERYACMCLEMQCGRSRWGPRCRQPGSICAACHHLPTADLFSKHPPCAISFARVSACQSLTSWPPGSAVPVLAVMLLRARPGAGQPPRPPHL